MEMKVNKFKTIEKPKKKHNGSYKNYSTGEPNMSLLDSQIVFGAEFCTEEAQSTQNC